MSSSAGVVTWTFVASPSTVTTSTPSARTSPESSWAVIADPWAQVYVDGKLVTVTPTAERIMVAPGRHFIKLVNPHFEVSSSEVRVDQGQVVRVEATLTPKASAPAQGAAP